MAGLDALVWHEHHFRTGDEPETDEDEVKGRIDACEDKDGKVFVWSAETRQVVAECKDRGEAAEVARSMARASRAAGPLPA